MDENNDINNPYDKDPFNEFNEEPDITTPAPKKTQ